ncbi:MAG: guanylate kinase [Flavobacteriales bacterium]|nr:guanylate kinase [Flavobacteriales bacterium]
MNGKVIIFSAPSGSGKTTLAKHVLAHFPILEFSISATTRSPRKGEVDGKDYFFLSSDIFKKHIDSADFVEWEEVYNGVFYGSLKSELNRIWAAGHHVVFDVDVKGGLALKKIFGPQALSVFIMPPSIDVLEKRLKTRATENESSVNQRINKAALELSFYNQFEVLIINDRIDIAKSDLEKVIADFLNMK